MSLLFTGVSDCVIWNDIHHKTQNHAGGEHGFPDANYFTNLFAELEAGAAAVYGELPMTIEYCESQDDTDKKRKLEAIIRENDQSGGLGVVVCCRDSQTTHLVKLYLSELGKKCLTINKESDVFDIHSTLTARSTSVIAVSDPVLPCLQLSLRVM